jgi:hypothetical protein
VLVDDADPAALGPALVWSARHGGGALHVVVDDRAAGDRDAAAQVAGPDGRSDAPASGVIARRAAAWADPPKVWRVEGRTLVAADPAPIPPRPALDDAVLRFVEVLRAHDVEPLVEDGTLIGEVLGLEVARVVPDTGDGWRLEVGVGRHDRMARAEMAPGELPGDALDQVAALVRARRRPGAARHPANTLALARWLRAAVVAAPDLAGAADLQAVAAPLPPSARRRLSAAAALGVDADGAPVVVVCSVGVDIDVVPTAADARVLHAGPDARLRIVVPEGDDYPVTRRLAGALAAPAEVVTVPKDWAAPR